MHTPSTNLPGPPIALTIAGSDSSGGAGIQADLKVFHTLGVHDVVAAQINALFADMFPSAVKTGMLLSADVVRAVSDILSRRKPTHIVVDPVITSSSGIRLLDDAGIEALIAHLIPQATVVTPNYPEAERLTGQTIRNDHDAKLAAQQLLAMGCDTVVLTGGHRTDRPADLYLDKDGKLQWLQSTFSGPDLHGTGCAFSAALTAFLAQSSTIPDAVQQAKSFITHAISNHLRWNNDSHALNLFPPQKSPE
jgi:hydroxymethylpyrimidine/phosphomethylpyrimidine kinase